MLAITNSFGLLVAARVDRQLASRHAHKLDEYYKSYPYYLLTDVFKAFRIADEIAINIFDMTDMPIINGTHFISFSGIIKLLIAFGSDPLNAYSVYENGGRLEDLKMTIVQDRKKWPKIGRAQSWPVLSALDNIIGAPTTISTEKRLLINLLSDVIPPSIRMPADIIDKTLVTEWIQLTHGCTQPSIKSRILGIGRDSPNVRRKRDGSYVVINKKFRPLYSRRIIDTKTLVRELVGTYPMIMLPYLYPSALSHITTIDLSTSPSAKKNTGYLVEYARSRELAVLKGDDPSVSIDVARACPIHDVDHVPEAIKNLWSFDEICMMYGPRV